MCHANDLALDNIFALEGVVKGCYCILCQRMKGIRNS